MYGGYGDYYDPGYVPVTPRRKRRSRSVPPPVTEVRTPIPMSVERRSNTSWVSSQYIRGLSVGPSYQQKAYDTVRRQYWVPQTSPSKRSLSNEGNLRPPPSYRFSMVRMGESTGLRQQDPYYYASRDHLARTGSYNDTYGRARPKSYHARATPSRVSSFYPSYRDDIYSPSYGIGIGTARRAGHQQHTPVIVQHDDLGETTKPLTKTHQAKSEPCPPPVRAVVMGKADLEVDHGSEVTELEQKAEDIKGVVSPPVRAVQLGETEVSKDHGGDVIDLQQHADTADIAVSPPVRAVQMGRADVSHDAAADLDDFEQFAEVAVDLDVAAHPVRAIQLGDADVGTDFGNGVTDLGNPAGGIATQKADVIEDEIKEE